MKKLQKLRIILIVISILCLIPTVCAILFFTFVVNEGETEPTVYMSTEYYTTLNDKVGDYYEIKTTIDITNSNKSAIDIMVVEATAKLDEIDSYQKSEEEVLGTGVADLNNSIDIWITTERTQLSRYAQIAQIIGEDGRTNSMAETNQANNLITQINNTAATNTELMNKALSDFYNLNYGK